MVKFYGFYGITPHHPLNYEFRNSNLAGSYFLGKCRAANSILYKSDIRSDELKMKGEVVKFQDFEIRLSKDEGIEIEDSFLVKTLVHNYSHDPESLEDFFIVDTVSAHYANVHGSPTNGSFLGPFATADLTTVNDCVLGAYSYIQAGEISHLKTDPLKNYIHFSAGKPPRGVLMDLVEDRKEAFQQLFSVVDFESPVPAPGTASLDRFAAVDRKTHISDNVLVAQRTCLENTWLRKGSNAQENCHIINARLEGNNVTAHGAKIIDSDLGENVFVGFNSFLRRLRNRRLAIGTDPCPPAFAGAGFVTA